MGEQLKMARMKPAGAGQRIPGSSQEKPKKTKENTDPRS
jgi:hypothetical protein